MAPRHVGKSKALRRVPAIAAPTHVPKTTASVPAPKKLAPGLAAIKTSPGRVAKKTTPEPAAIKTSPERVAKKTTPEPAAKKTALEPAAKKAARERPHKKTGPQRAAQKSALSRVPESTEPQGTKLSTSIPMELQLVPKTEVRRHVIRRTLFLHTTRGTSPQLVAQESQLTVQKSIKSQRMPKKRRPLFILQSEENDCEDIYELDESECNYRTGYGALVLEKIVGVTKLNKHFTEIMFIVKWKNHEALELVSNKIMNNLFPYTIIEYYESIIKWAE